jgi:hypothetical protein
MSDEILDTSPGDGPAVIDEAVGAARPRRLHSWPINPWKLYWPAAAPVVVSAFLAVMLFTPLWLARPKEDFRPELPRDFVWTGIEKQHFRKLETVQAPLYIGALDEVSIPDTGLGAVSRDTGRKVTITDALQRMLRENASPGGDDESRQLGASSQVLPTYGRALNLFNHGQFGDAESQLRAADDKIAKTHPETLSATLRLNGEQVLVDYLLGHTLLKEHNPKGAVEVFARARTKAVAQREIKNSPYAGEPTLLFDLEPRASVTSLSTAVLWNDELTALAGVDPEKAWSEAAPLYERPDVVAHYPVLAATLQRLAATHGDADKVTAIQLDWSKLASSDIDNLARRISAASRVAMGEATAIADFADGPKSDENQLQVWTKIAKLRVDVHDEINEEKGDAAGDLAVAQDPSEREFIGLWRRQYLQEIGDQLLQTAERDHDKNYLKLAALNGLFDKWSIYRARSQLLGPGPWLMPLVLTVPLLIGSALAVYIFLVTRVFRPLHYLTRRGR